MKVKQHITNSYEDTYSLGQLFSQEINLGNTILLYGDLGAGKTAFVKGDYTKATEKIGFTLAEGKCNR